MPLLARGVFWVCAFIIVAAEVARQWALQNFLLALLAIPMFPLTFFLSPWFNGTQIFFVVGMIGYAVSTAGGMRPVDQRPRMREERRGDICNFSQIAGDRHE